MKRAAAIMYPFDRKFQSLKFKTELNIKGYESASLYSKEEK